MSGAQNKHARMKILGFYKYLGPGLMPDGMTLGEFCENYQVSFRLSDGTELGGIRLDIVEYDNDSGYATVLFDRSLSEISARTLLDDEDLLIIE